MGFHMKTTLEIDEGVMRALKARAARDGTTMSELVERALRTLLEERRVAPKDLPPLPTWDLGPLVNVDSRAEWYDQLEEDGDVRG
jgi:hypothetical protein